MSIIYCLSGEENDLEYFVRECGDALGVTASLPLNDRSPKRILEHVLHQIIEYKKLNQVESAILDLQKAHARRSFF